MLTYACRSTELEHLDWFVFSILFSRSIAYNYADVCACFVFFYMTFYVIHATRDESMCTDDTTGSFSPSTSIYDFISQNK
jgi:hypothetical protein